MRLAKCVRFRGIHDKKSGTDKMELRVAGPAHDGTLAEDEKLEHDPATGEPFLDFHRLRGLHLSKEAGDGGESFI